MSNELKNVRVEHSGEATINLGNFENFKPGYRVSADVADGVHPDVAREKLKALVDRWLNEDIAEAVEDASS